MQNQIPTIANYLKRPYIPEAGIFIFAALTRFIRLGEPKTHIFDEVYHAFTAQEMYKGNPAAWEWWNTPPKGFAYEWTHPPLAKEFMVIAIRIFGDNAFAWRFFSAVFGTGIIILIYFIALKLFKNRLLALIAALVASLDGLLLVMSRIAMNDAYFIFFALLALLLFLYNRKLLTGIALGLAFASKWTGLFGVGLICLLFAIDSIQQFIQKPKTWPKLIGQGLYAFLCFIVLPVLIYIATYIPFFFGGSHIPPNNGQPTTQFEKLLVPQSAVNTNWQTFIGLQEQMWWYHTGLKAHHDYQSRPWQWVLNLRPVWFYVDDKDSSIANIYALGNPLFIWFGAISILFVAWDFITKRSKNLATILLGYFSFFLPWVDSPRIMFFYHYTPAIPFLALASAYVLHEFLSDKLGRYFTIALLVIMFGLFIYFYPLWTGIHVPKDFNNTYYWFKSWK